MTDISEKAKALLHKENYSIVIMNGDTYTSTKKGIAPLMDILADNPSFLKIATVADKVIGRAAALLMIYGGVKEVYSDVISTHALDIFKANNILVEYGECVPYIINRTKDGMCPMENAVLDVTEPQKAYEILKNKLEMMRK